MGLYPRSWRRRLGRPGLFMSTSVRPPVQLAITTAKPELQQQKEKKRNEKTRQQYKQRRALYVTLQQIQEASQARNLEAHQAGTMGLEHYFTIMLTCSHSSSDHGSSWNEWDASNRHRIITAKIRRSIFERIGTKPYCCICSILSAIVLRRAPNIYT